MKVQRKIYFLSQLPKILPGAKEYYGDSSRRVSFHALLPDICLVIWEGIGKISRIEKGWLYEVEFKRPKKTISSERESWIKFLTNWGPTLFGSSFYAVDYAREIWRKK